MNIENGVFYHVHKRGLKDDIWKRVTLSNSIKSFFNAFFEYYVQ